MAAGVAAGDRRALARAITLVESTRADRAEAGERVVETLLAKTGTAIRLGVSGSPGAGKSTFIEALGGRLLAAGRRVAVLAVDPSSELGGGSILGDKTRMDTLATADGAFVRPSPSGGALGGVAPATREALLLCEAAGYDVVIVETVGVGQSETDVAGMVDTFCLLLLPNAGDGLQAVKRGIIELADVLVVTKADGAGVAAAQAAAAEVEAALSLLGPGRGGPPPRVMTASARAGAGLNEVWAAVVAHRAALAADGTLATRRAAQNRRWLWRAIDRELGRAFRSTPAVAAALPDAERAIAAGRRSPGLAARELVAAVLGRPITE